MGLCQKSRVYGTEQKRSFCQQHPAERSSHLRALQPSWAADLVNTNIDKTATFQGASHSSGRHHSSHSNHSCISECRHSRPMKPSGMPSAFVADLISPSSPKLELITKSTGRMISTPRDLAFAVISGTIFAPSSSYRDVPMAMPSLTFRYVYAIPPPMMILLTLSSMFMMSWILSLTLAPPRMARTGLVGVSKILANASSSLDIRAPAAFTSKPSPTIELWALWAVPKASLQ